MASYLYFCTECNKLFKVTDTGKKVKCSNCSKPLVDLNISDDIYATLHPEKREALKNKARESVDPPVEAVAQEVVEREAVEREVVNREAVDRVEQTGNAGEEDTRDTTEEKREEAVKEEPQEKKDTTGTRGIFDINALLYGSGNTDAVVNEEVRTEEKTATSEETGTEDNTAESEAVSTEERTEERIEVRTESEAGAQDDNEIEENTSEEIETETETETEAETTDETNTEANAELDTQEQPDELIFSQFFNIEDSFKDPYMSEDAEEPIINRISETNTQLGSAIEKQTEDVIAVKNNYLKLQIQNQLLAVDNFISICKLSALQDDGVVDKDEEKLLKKLERAAGDYKKALSRLI